MKKKTVFKWVLVAALIGGGAMGYHFFQQKAEAAAGPASSVVSVTQGSIEVLVTAQGSLEPRDYVDVGAQVSGQLEVLHVEIGDHVQKGDIIAEIDAEVYETQVAGDEARLKTLQAQKIQIEAEIKQAQQKHDRNLKLIKNDAISQEALEDTEAALDIANASLMSLEAQIEEAQSTLDGNKVNLNYTKIYAPMAGTVVSEEAKEGETLNANQTTPTIVQVANLEVMTVKAEVAEADINKITVGMPVYFTTLGSQERRWEGEVRQILPTPEIVNDVVLYNVLVDVENKDGKLMNGMTTQLFFVQGKADNVPVVPATALLRKAPTQENPDAGTAYIVKVKQGQAIVDETVLVGLSDRKNAEIISGLSIGDEVVVPTAQSSEKASSNFKPPVRF